MCHAHSAGPLSTDEKITAFAFAITISLWIFGAQIGVNAVAAALLGLAILLITGVVEWKENLAQVTTAPHRHSCAPQPGNRKVACFVNI